MDKVVHLKELRRKIEKGKEERGKIKWILTMILLDKSLIYGNNEEEFGNI